MTEFLDYWRLTNVKMSYQNCLEFVILCNNGWLKFEVAARLKSVSPSNDQQLGVTYILVREQDTVPAVLARCQAVWTFPEVVLDLPSLHGHPAILRALDHCIAALVHVSLGVWVWAFKTGHIVVPIISSHRFPHPSITLSYSSDLEPSLI